MAEESSLVRLQAEYDLDLDWRGFELHPEVPEGGSSLSDLFPPERLAGMSGYLNRFARDFGLPDLAVTGRIQNTRRALAVAEWARDQGKIETYCRAAMTGYWRDGLNLEDQTDLREVTNRAGLDPDAAWAARTDPAWLARVDALRDEAHTRGVTGIPTFFFGDLPPVVGCQPYATLARTAEAAGALRRSEG